MPKAVSRVAKERKRDFRRVGFGVPGQEGDLRIPAQGIPIVPGSRPAQDPPPVDFGYPKTRYWLRGGV